MVDAKQNVWGLEWLIDEVETSLHEAYSTLEAYLNDDSNEQQLQFCLSHLHQVSGSLKIVACHGGALLVEEMELVVRAMIDGEISDIAEASELLVNAILKVPAYLREILSNRRDEPAILLTLLNDLRALRNQPLATGSSLFNPDFGFMAASPANITPDAQRLQATIDLVKKLRQIYQFALLGVLKKQELEKNVNFLRKVSERLQELFSGSQRQQLWRAASAILQSLKLEEPSIAQRHLLWELDKELRAIIQHDGAAFDVALPESLLRNLLYYVLIISSTTNDDNDDLIQTLCDDFKLHEALPKGAISVGEGGLTPTYNRAVVETLSSSLGDELDIIKEALENHLQSSSTPADAVSQISTNLKKISDTLAIAGYAPARQTALAISAQLATYINQQQASRIELAPIVSNVVLLENILKAWPLQDDDNEVAMDDDQQAAYMLGAAQQALLAEVHNSIEQVKDAIVGYISSRNDKQHLEEVPRLLNEMQRAMAIIDYRRLAEIIKSCGSYVSKELIHGAMPPQWQDIDALADSIISIEYYLDSLGSAETGESEKILITAEQKLSALGYTPQPEVAALEISTETKAAVGPAALAIVEPIPESIFNPSPELEITLPKTESTPETASALNTPLETSSESTHTALDEFSLNIDTGTPNIASPNAIPDASAEALTAAPTGSDDIAQQDSDEDKENEVIDPEIREIFVTEAREVLSNLQGYMSEWLAGNNASLPDIRRAFHTLKGSGRMVNAMAIGELGWAVENVLNRIVEGSLTKNDDVTGLIERALHIIPGMVTEFEQGQAHSNLDFVEALQAAAEPIARGENTSLPPLPGATPTTEMAIKLTGASEQEPSEQSTILAGDSANGMGISSASEADIQVESEQDFEFDQASLSELNAALGLSEPANSILESDSALETSNAVLPEEDALSIQLDTELDAETQAELDTESTPEISEDPDYDETLLTIFTDEADTYLGVITAFVTEAQASAPFFSVPPNSLLRALHTLKGSAHMSGVTFVAQIATHLDQLANEMVDRQIAMNETIIEHLNTATVLCRDAISAMQQARRAVEPEGCRELIEQLSALTTSVQTEPLKKNANEVSGSDQALRGLMAEGMHHALGAGEMLDIWLFEPDALQQQQPEMVAELRDIAAAANEAQLPQMQALCDLLVRVYQRIKEHEALLTDDVIANLNKGHDLLLNMIDAVAAYQDIPDFPSDLQAQLQTIASTELPITDADDPELNIVDNTTTLSKLSDDLTDILDDLPSELDHTEPNDLDSFSLSEPFEIDAFESELSTPEPLEPEPVADEASPVVAQHTAAVAEDVDEELVTIFLEEADDLSEEVEAAIMEWKETPRNRQPIDVLKRALHTLKGGARMTGCAALGNLCHDFETDVIHAEPHRDQLSPDFFDGLLNRYDQLLSELEQIKTGTPSGGFAQPIDDPEQAYHSGDQTEPASSTSGTPDTAAVSAIIEDSDEAPAPDILTGDTGEQAPPSIATEYTATPSAQEGTAAVLPFASPANTPVTEAPLTSAPSASSPATPPPATTHC